MKKKSFRGFDSFLGGPVVKEQTKSACRTTSTFEFNRETLESIRAIAHCNHTAIWKVINKALNLYIENYIKKNGEIKPIPESNEYDI